MYWQSHVLVVRPAPVRKCLISVASLCSPQLPTAHAPVLYCCVPPPCFAVQIVQFIIQNTGSGPQQAPSDLPITGGFCDPFTGGGPREAPAPVSRPPAAALAAAAPISITGGFCDPFTGGAGASSSRTQLPARVYLLFDGPPPAEGLRNKLLEFNALLKESPELGPAALITQQEAEPGGEQGGRHTVVRNQ